MFPGARLKPGTRIAALKTVALLLPIVGLVVVAVALPETGLIGCTELQPPQPLGALPEIARRHHQPQRPAVVGSQRLVVRFVRDQRLVSLKRLERQVRGEPLLRVGDHVARTRLRFHDFRELVPVHAAEARIEAAPARDAVDVDADFAARELFDFLPRQGQRLVDLAEHTEVPRREVRLRDRPRVQDGPLLRQVLPGRQARGIESALDELPLRLCPEQGHASLHYFPWPLSRHALSYVVRVRSFASPARIPVTTSIAWSR